MKIFLFPIEPLEERYSAQWYRWFPSEFDRIGVEHRTISGLRNADVIQHGQFLDVVDTHYWKATQLANFIARLRDGEVVDGDWVLLADAWNPALEQLAYIRDLGHVKFHIAGCWHAGSYDPWDMLGQSSAVRSWAEHAERGYLEALDLAFVATNFHAELLTEARSSKRSQCRIVTTGFPLFAREWVHHKQPWEERTPRVVFPHRLAIEKAPLDFEWIRSRYQQLYGDNLEWVVTKEVCKTKEDYYRVLGSSTIAVSCALQETWGIAMLEATSLGCWPVVPNRLSYCELYPSELRYEDRLEAVELIRRLAKQDKPAPYEDHKWTHAISNMVACMEDM